MKTTKRYRGRVRDRMNALDVRWTRWYDTYKDAHDAAEKLCRRTMGERGDISILDEYGDGY